MNQNKLINKRTLFAAFIIPIIGMLILYAATNVFPFGPKTPVIQDMLRQYISITSFMRRAITHPSMLFYSGQIGLGVNTWPMFTYYGTSPFTLIALLFPTAYLPFFFELNILVSIGLIGLTSYVCLVKSRIINSAVQLSKISIFLPLTFSSTYALSGYLANYAFCVMWTNAIILFPLIMLAWEKVILGGKLKFYLILLAITIFINYYMGIMIVEYLFVVSVFWLFYLALKKQIFQKQVLLRIFRLIGATALAIIINCVILLPSFLAQKQVSQAHFILTLKKIMSFHELLNSLLPLPSQTAVPVLYGGILIVPLLVLYFCIKGIDWQEKLTAFTLTVALLFSTVNLSLFMAWHMFSMPNGLYQREGFLIIFTLLVLAYRTMGLNMSNYQVTKRGWISFALIMLILMGLAYGPSLRQANINLLLMIASLILAIILIVITLQYRPKAIKLVFVLGFVEILVTTLPIYRLDSDISLSWRPYIKYAGETQRVVSRLQKSDKSFYRLGMNAELNNNANMLFGYADISGYVSQLPNSETDYLSQLGYYQKHSWYRWADYNNGSTLAVNRLLGYKYYLTYDHPQRLIDMSENHYMNYSVANQPARYIKHNKRVSPNYWLSKDSQAAGLVISGQEAMFADNQIHYDPSQDPFSYYNQLLAETSGLKNVYRPLVVQSGKRTKTHADYDLRSDGRMTYIYIPTAASGDINPIKVYANGKKITTAYGGYAEGENGIICLGQYPTGSMIHVRLNGEGVPQAKTVIFRSETAVNLAKSRKYLSKIAAHSNRISFNTSNNNHSRNFLITMANVNGWHAKIDGKTVPIYQAAGGMMGVKLPSTGAHHVQLSYIPPKLRLSLAISGLALLVSIVFVIKTDKSISKEN